MKLIDFFKKHSSKLAILFLCTTLLNGCKSCSKNRVIEFNKIKYENRLDSIQAECNKLNDSLDYYKYQLNTTNVINNKLQEDNNYYKQSNMDLIDTNRKIINKRK
jgi:hypothetical protein